jgi:Spy/CpxP family protein refolding chaperone
MRLDQARWWMLPIAMMLPLACSNNGGAEGAANTASPPATTATATATAAVTATATATATAKTERPRMHARRGAGIAGMLLHAAHDLDLKDAQKATLEKLAEELHGAGPRKELKELHTSLIAEVKAGKIDTAKLSASYDAIDKAVADRHDKEIEVLNGLYAALDPAQRKALVAAVKAKQAAREAHMAEREKKGEGDWSKRRLEHLTKELDLDAAEQKSVGALLEKGDKPMAAAMATHREEAKKRMDAVLTAFEGEGFDAKKIELAGPGKKLRERLEHHVQFLSQLLPLLKPEQREKLAASMEKHTAVRSPDGAQHDDEQPYHPIFDEQHTDEEPAAPATP